MNIQGTKTRADLMGRLRDCDAHLYMEPEVMADIVSEVGGGFVVDFLRKFTGSPQDVEARSRNRSDVLGVKGISALGSCDPLGRIDAMDSTGVQAQLVFPNTALLELRLSTDAARTACRHYNDYALDWTRDQAIAYMKENTSHSESFIVAEVDRYIVWPAQALGYKLGELKIKELRAKATEQLGTRFDIRKFHNAVIDHASLPLTVLEQVITVWIDEQRSGSAS